VAPKPLKCSSLAGKSLKSFLTLFVCEFTLSEGCLKPSTSVAESDFGLSHVFGKSDTYATAISQHLLLLNNFASSFESETISSGDAICYFTHYLLHLCML
jgi:hypothetical protein